MRTVGQILKEVRESKFYSLDEVEKATKIRKELLVALENGDFSKLPPPTFVQGFIKNYAHFLSLDENKLLAIFRREFSGKKHQPYIMDAFAKPMKENRFILTPARVLGLVVLTLVLSFFIYLWLQYRQFAGTPNLKVVSPLDQMTTETTRIFVEGETDPEVKVIVNGQEIAVGSGGEFKEEITLSDPVNKINIKATSKFGQKTEVERMVYLKK